MFLSYVGEWAPGGADRDPADRQLSRGRSRYKALHHHTVFRVLEFSRLLQGFEGFLRDIVRPDGILEGFERLVKIDGLGVRLLQTCDSSRHKLSGLRTYSNLPCKCGPYGSRGFALGDWVV